MAYRDSGHMQRGLATFKAQGAPDVEAFEIESALHPLLEKPAEG